MVDWTVSLVCCNFLRRGVLELLALSVVSKQFVRCLHLVIALTQYHFAIAFHSTYYHASLRKHHLTMAPEFLVIACLISYTSKVHPTSTFSHSRMGSLCMLIVTVTSILPMILDYRSSPRIFIEFEKRNYNGRIESVRIGIIQHCTCIGFHDYQVWSERP